MVFEKYSSDVFTKSARLNDQSYFLNEIINLFADDDDDGGNDFVNWLPNACELLWF